MNSEKLESVIEDLQHLHVLSQTETLMIDEADFAGLDRVTSAKEVIVGHITSTIPPKSDGVAPKDIDLELRSRLQEMLALIEKVSEIEERNRVRLEQLRSGALHALQVLHHERKLRRTYK